MDIYIWQPGKLKEHLLLTPPHRPFGLILKLMKLHFFICNWISTDLTFTFRFILASVLWICKCNQWDRLQTVLTTSDLNEYLHLATWQTKGILDPHPTPLLPTQTIWSHSEAHEATFLHLWLDFDWCNFYVWLYLGISPMDLQVQSIWTVTDRLINFLRTATAGFMSQELREYSHWEKIS